MDAFIHSLLLWSVLLRLTVTAPLRYGKESAKSVGSLSGLGLVKGGMSEKLDVLFFGILKAV